MAKKKQAEPQPVLDVPYLCQKDLLAIIGTADPTRQMAPYGDENFEVWGVAVAATYSDVKRLDVQFELHPSDYWTRDANVEKRLAETKVPIYMHEKFPNIPTSMRYPIELVTAHRKYFTNSIAYMLALAYHGFKVTGNPKHVALFGIHMQTGEEYAEQRPCCEYWLGRMEGAGMDIEMAPGGALLQAIGLYGYEKYNPVCWDMRQRIFGIQAGVGQCDGEIQKWMLQKSKNEGAQYECEYWLRKFQRGEFNK